jgi:biopolymer transport protein TolQ
MLTAIAGILAQTEQIAETNLSEPTNANIISLAMNSDFVVQITLLLLVLFSVVSWAIIGSKHRQLKHAKDRSRKFFQLFSQAKSIDAIVSKGSFRKSPAFNIFKTAIDTLRENQDAKSSYLVEREIHRAVDDEVSQMEYGVSFLATTGSATPFIGLFGTVWGILHAFWKIGRTGASSLAVVGPYIAEALIATAIGLVAAIPAVIFYNLYLNRINRISKDLSNFGVDLNERITREYYGAV